jgi:hypothetical protein
VRWINTWPIWKRSSAPLSPDSRTTITAEDAEDAEPHKGVVYTRRSHQTAARRYRRRPADRQKQKRALGFGFHLPATGSARRIRGRGIGCVPNVFLNRAQGHVRFGTSLLSLGGRRPRNTFLGRGRAGKSNRDGRRRAGIDVNIAWGTTEAARALAGHPHPAALNRLRAILGDADESVSRAALHGLLAARDGNALLTAVNLLAQAASPLAMKRESWCVCCTRSTSAPTAEAEPLRFSRHAVPQAPTRLRGDPVDQSRS